MFLLKSLFGEKPEMETARALYAETIHAARRTAFYTELGVPDSPEGRFEMLALTAFLVLRRLKTEPGAKDIAQAYFDVMFEDIDSNLRELGVGDISVGKKVKKLAESFYGRIKAYEDALAETDDQALQSALAHYPLRGTNPVQANLERLARHVRREDATLAALPTPPLLEGDIRFADIDADGKGAA